MLNFIFRTSERKPLLSIQKFHRLLVEGIKSQINEIEVISSIPVVRTTNRKIFWFKKSEVYKGIKYFYIPFINIGIIRQVLIILFSFFRIFLWCLKNSRGNSVIICDVLNVSIASSALINSKIWGVKACAIVTDVPEMLGNIEKKRKGTALGNWASSISSSQLALYDSYVFLSAQMNDLLNTRNKPFLIMEGLVDINMSKFDTPQRINSTERILIYSGGIFEKYGVKTLIEAFMLLEDPGLRLHIYGAGEMETDMSDFMKHDTRINYFGVVENQIVVQRQSEATLLINPRKSNEEFTKYSFPSKNLEYMASGTPLVTTALPAMPKEYYNYVYIFSDESVIGMRNTLLYILSLPQEELQIFGKKAKQFVLENKSNIKQSERLIDFLKTIHILKF